MVTTTLNRVHNRFSKMDWFQPLLEGIGKTEPDDEPLPYAKILEIVGFDCAILCCKCERRHYKIWRQFAIWCYLQNLCLKNLRLQTCVMSLKKVNEAKLYADKNCHYDAGIKLACDRASISMPWNPTKDTLDLAYDDAWALAWSDEIYDFIGRKEILKRSFSKKMINRVLKAQEEKFLKLIS